MEKQSKSVFVLMRYFCLIKGKQVKSWQKYFLFHKEPYSNGLKISMSVVVRVFVCKVGEGGRDCLMRKKIKNVLSNT